MGQGLGEFLKVAEGSKPHSQGSELLSLSCTLVPFSPVSKALAHSNVPQGIPPQPLTHPAEQNHGVFRVPMEPDR